MFMHNRVYNLFENHASMATTKPSQSTNRRVINLEWCAHCGAFDERCVQLTPRPVKRLAVQNVGGIF